MRIIDYSYKANIKKQGSQKMIKVYFHLKRKPGMSVEEFQQHWREVHVPATQQVPTLRKYIFCLPLASEYEQGEPLWDGIGETWWDSEAAFEAFTQTPEGQVVINDLSTFSDQTAPPAFYKEEIIIK